MRALLATAVLGVVSLSAHELQPFAYTGARDRRPANRWRSSRGQMY
jgi:hypothetical protein